MNNKYYLLLFLSLLSSCSQEEPTKSQEQQLSNNSKSLLEIVEGSNLGLNFIHDAAFSDEFSIYEPLGSGVAILDYDNDDDMDIFIPQYGSSKGFSKLYGNTNGKFIDVTTQFGLEGLDELIFASVADVNNDGFTDILIGGKNKLSLWINQGGKSFKLSQSIKAANGNQFYTSASWFDLNRDGFLDVWVTNYVDDSIEAQCKSANGDRDYCPPKSYQPLADLLLISNKGKSFDTKKTTPQLGEISPGLGVVSDDFDNNGWPDIYIANDGVANQLFYNFDGVLAVDSAKINGAAFNMMGTSEASMGIAIGDVDNNSYPDLYVTHFKGETNTFYLNNKGIFSDNTAFLKLIKNVRRVTGFGTLLVDYNTDNRLDIIAVNGSTQYDKSLTKQERLQGEVIQIWQNQNDLNFKFDEDVKKSIEKRVGRGLASIDIDNDGDYDFIVNNNNQPLSVMINNSNPSQWVGIIPFCNKRIDYGAKLLISSANNENTLHRTVHVDGSYASSIDPRLLIYNNNDYQTITINWSTSHDPQVFNIDNLIHNTYNTLNCQLATH